jgi:excinuclease UvrABC helicase subunit UvrB
MFGKRRFNSLFRDFDSLFNEMNSMFNDTPYYIKGKSNVENGNDENGKWTKESFISDDGSYSITTIIRTNTEGTKPEVSNTKLDQLKKELSNAVEEQEFETAAKLRDQIKYLENNQEKINELKSKLEESITNQNFEESIKLRDQIKELES